VVRVPQKWWDKFSNESIIEDSHHAEDCDGCGDEELHLVARIAEKRPVRTLAHALFLDLSRDELECLHRQADWYAYFWFEVEGDDGAPEFRREYRAAGRQSRAFAVELNKYMTEGN
jgi:hypothetical protein